MPRDRVVARSAIKPLLMVGICFLGLSQGAATPAELPKTLLCKQALSASESRVIQKEFAELISEVFGGVAARKIGGLIELGTRDNYQEDELVQEVAKSFLGAYRAHVTNRTPYNGMSFLIQSEPIKLVKAKLLVQGTVMTKNGKLSITLDIVQIDDKNWGDRRSAIDYTFAKIIYGYLLGLSNIRAESHEPILIGAGTILNSRLKTTLKKYGYSDVVESDSQNMLPSRL